MSFADTIKNLNSSLNGSVYSTWIKFKCGELEVNTADRDSNYFMSLENSKNGSGSANNFTIAIAFVPEPGGNPNIIDQKVAGSLAEDGDLCELQYGYNMSPGNLSTPKYTGKPTDYNVEVRDGMLYYTFTGYSSVIALKEDKFDFDQKGIANEDGSVSEGVRPTDAVKEEFERCLAGLGYTIRIDSSALSKDAPIVIGASSEITVFDYAKTTLALAQDESASTVATGDDSVEDPTESTSGTYTYVIDDRSDKKEIVIKRIDNNPDNIEAEITFDWMSQGNNGNLVVNFSTQYKGAMVLSAKSDKSNEEDANLKYSINSKGEIVEANTIKDTVTAGDTADSDAVLEKSAWADATSASYPATLVTIGLPCEIPIGTYIRVNPLIYGVKHHSAGIYMVQNCVDRVDSSGYTTTLNLLKIKS